MPNEFIPEQQLDTGEEGPDINFGTGAGSNISLAEAAEQMQPKSPVSLPSVSVEKMGAVAAGAAAFIRTTTDKDKEGTKRKDSEPSNPKEGKTDKEKTTLSEKETEEWGSADDKALVLKESGEGKWSDESHRVWREAFARLKKIPGITGSEIESRLDDMRLRINKQLDAAGPDGDRVGTLLVSPFGGQFTVYMQLTNSDDPQRFEDNRAARRQGADTGTIVKLGNIKR